MAERFGVGLAKAIDWLADWADRAEKAYYWESDRLWAKRHK